jgi:hypothetical protein
MCSEGSKQVTQRSLLCSTKSGNSWHALLSTNPQRGSAHCPSRYHEALDAPERSPGCYHSLVVDPEGDHPGYVAMWNRHCANSICRGEVSPCWPRPAALAPPTLL